MAEKKPNQLTVVHDNLQKMLQSKQKALPKNFNQTRFLQNCMVVLQDTKGIENMNGASVARTMLKGAFLGLDFFNKECYAIPYGTSLNFQTDYKGEIKLAKKYSINPIKEIYAKLVREGDEFEEKIVHGNQTINFKPKPFSNNKIIGAFAICNFKDGSMIYDTMTTEEIEKVRDKFSKVPTGKAWKDSFGEMAKKTVLRRLTKLIEYDFDNSEQNVVYEESADNEFEEAEYIPIEMPQVVEDEPEQTDEPEPVSKPAEKENAPQGDTEPLVDLDSRTIIRSTADKLKKNLDEALLNFGDYKKLEDLPQSKAHDFIKFLKE